ncbi:MAG: L-arabinose isomerase [Clostridia bacterium]|nr:L-arabinose isomerase [Clostridia bacterium]
MNSKKIWFVCGGQHLYGTEAFSQMRSHANEIANALNEYTECKIVFKELVTTSAEITAVMRAANAEDSCVGIITWMHVFSPSKMWIEGFSLLQKPLLHLHTQYNREIPWDSIDMDFMNLNQSAHGDREHGFIGARMRLSREIVTGYWRDEDVCQSVAQWARCAAAYAFSKTLKVARFGDNMRYVAVTEGDKVEAQIKFGWSVNGYGMGDLTEVINNVSEGDVSAKMDEYNMRYEMNTNDVAAVAQQAKYEVGMRRFLDAEDCRAFTTTFEDLHGLKQLPGLAVQNMLFDGYGFGAEGDWKTSALTAVMKYMAQGLKGGTAFMEDYTYNFAGKDSAILGAHMLEVCPSVAAEKPKIEVHPLGIGGKEPPARLVFDGTDGHAVASAIIDMGDRFRMITISAQLLAISRSMPKLPVARLLWKPLPNLKTSATAWIMAGGAHHTCLSNALNENHMRTFARMCDMEFVLIDENCDLDALEKELLYNDVIYRLR